MCYFTAYGVLMTSTYSDKVARILLHGFLPFGMFVFLTGKILLPGSPSHIAQTYIWLMFPTLVFCLIYGKKLFKGYKVTWLELSVAGFILLNLLSFSWSSTEQSFSRYYKDALYITLFLIVTCTLLRSSKLDLGRVFEISALVVAIGAGVSLYYHFILNDAIIQFRQNRIFTMGPWEFGNFNNPIPAALFYGPFALILFARFLEAKRQWIHQAILLTAILFIQSYVMMTGSRGPIYAMFCGYLVLVILNRKVSSFVLGATLAGFIITLGVHNGMFKINIPFINTSAITSPISDLIPVSAGTSFRESPTTQEIEDLFNRKFSQRGSIWLGAIEESLKAPWLGHGINAPVAIPFFKNRQIAFHTHNLYLQILYDTGLAGLSLFFMMTVLSIRSCWHYRSQLVAQLALALFVFGLLGFVADVHKIFNKPDPFWLLYWLPVGMTIGIRVKGAIGMISFTAESRKVRAIQTISLNAEATQRSKEEKKVT